MEDTMKINRMLTVCTVLLVLTSATASIATTYQMYDIGLSAQGYSSDALGINNRGEVVGCVRIDGKDRGFIWDRVSGMRYITPAGVDNTPRDINDNGLIVGESFESPQNMHGFTLDDVHGLQYTQTAAGLIAVNNSGQAVGYTSRDGSGNVAYWDTEGGEQDLGLRGSAYNISDNGMITGCVDGRGFAWDSVNRLTDIGALGNYGRTFGVNDSGQVSGTIWQAGVKTQAFIWDKDHGMQMLGILPGSDESHAIRVNNRGQVVGYCNLRYVPRACVWDGINGMQALPALFSNGMCAAGDVNDDGWIAGWATDPTTTMQHAVVWVPVPEPSTMMVLVAGVSALIIRKRK